MSKKNFIRKIFTFINKKLFLSRFSIQKKSSKVIYMRLIGMKLTGRRNFGDAVNKVFWSKITNKKILKDCSNEHFITTGSIMNLVQTNSIVFGTGFISENGDLGGGNFLSSFNKKNSIPKEVISVRGPRTREKLLSFNIDCPDNFGDPLILLPCIYPVKKNVKNKLVGIRPHYIDKNSKLLSIIKSLWVNMI